MKMPRIFAASMLALTTAMSPALAQAQDAPACSQDLAAVQQVVATIPPAVPETPWVLDSDTNFDTCRTLSYATATVAGGTASSPKQLMLFHKGEYLGTGATKSAAHLRVVEAGEDYVRVEYGVPGQDNAHIRWLPAVTYFFMGDHVEIFGDVPPELS